ncbi:galactose-3-O-sulfotransferase 2 [Trichomycterus rosablanca]|uniref:galactose-3-O-sulfotransferase 2 n=1 Tax=Trichomycterus rosablanca TaxID=2290929 RepID=UPI002F3599C0
MLCCSHLRFMWQVLTLLTALCVALQLLSVVRQSWNMKAFAPIRQWLLEAPTEKLLRSTTDWTDHHVFQWQDPNQEDLHPDQRRNRISETVKPRLNTTAHRRLASTAGIPIPTGHQRATKPAPKILTEDHWVERKAPTQPRPPNPEISSTTSQVAPPNKPPDQRPSSQAEGMRACHPKTHIVFLKTHKTASSTILNVLYRYGESRNLTFALPVNSNSQLFYPHLFMSYFVEGVKTGAATRFHIMCNHMRFNALQVKKLMPSDTFYFSILRNPVSMMESLFTYYKLIPAFYRFKTLEDFLLDAGRSYNASWPGSHYARNVLTFDFGFDGQAPSDEAELDRRAVALISGVESRFHLVLISEYFDESMVLLRHALCWTLEDVASFRLNSRSEKSRRPLSPGMAERVTRWSSLDWRLYRHFNASFWHRVDTSLGRAKLRLEVESLRAKRAELQRTCLLEGGAVDPRLVRDSSLKPFQYGQAVIQGYNVRPGLDDDTRRLCERLIRPELQYTSLLYAKQFPDLAAKQAAAAKHNTRPVRKSFNSAGGSRKRMFTRRRLRR